MLVFKEGGLGVGDFLEVDLELGLEEGFESRVDKLKGGLVGFWV